MGYVGSGLFCVQVITISISFTPALRMSLLFFKPLRNPQTKFSAL